MASKRGTAFRKVVICQTNGHPPEKNDKIKGWVEFNGAKYVKELTPDVTHLVTSKKAWKNYDPLVKEARRGRKVYIVKLAWLEDCLLARPRRAIHADKYLFEQTKLQPLKLSRKRDSQENVEGPERQTKKLKIPRDKRIETAGIEFDNACKEFEEDMGSADFHPYSDSTGFVYIITLPRHDIDRSCFEKYKLKVGSNPPSISRDIMSGNCPILHLFPAPWPFSNSPVVPIKTSSKAKSKMRVHIAEPWAMCLQLYESDNQPHTYACYLQYTRPGTKKKLHVLAPPASTWSFAWDVFKSTFERKVRTAWHQRPKNGAYIDIGGEDDEAGWQYLAPKLGEPEGLQEGVVMEEVVEVGSDEATRCGEDVEDAGRQGSEWEAFTTPEESEPALDDTHRP